MTTSFWRRALVAAAVALSLVALALLVWRLADILLLGFAGVLVAVFLRACAEPVHRATRLPEGWALAVVGLVLAGLTALGGWLLLPSLIVQAGGFLARLPDLVSQLEAALIAVPFLGEALQVTPSLSGMADRASSILARAFSTLSTTTPQVWRRCSACSERFLTDEPVCRACAQLLHNGPSAKFGTLARLVFNLIGEENSHPTGTVLTG